MPLTPVARLLRLVLLPLLPTSLLLSAALAQSEAPPAAAEPPKAAGPAPQAQKIAIAYLGIRRESPPVYDYESLPGDAGVAGARIAMRDMKTTGRLTGQDFVLDEHILARGESPVDAAKALVAKGETMIVADLPARDLVAVADTLKGSPAQLFNIQSEDDALRQVDCRENLFDVAPSRSMLTDALVQFLFLKQWRRVFLIVGKNPEDALYADAVRRSVKKFGMKLVGDKPWEFGNLARERADGPTQADALVFTRGTSADVIIVADEAGNFGDYIQYHTSEPKLVTGTQGLTPTTWSQVLDAWGSAQLQSRFVRTNKRTMRPLDYQAWVAVRAIGEAATRAKSADPKEIVATMLKPDFEIAAFKGVPVTVRPWDHQLRQPILLVQPKMLVSVAPEPGFLNPVSPLDTLGFDKPESACHLSAGGKS